MNNTGPTKEEIEATRQKFYEDNIRPKKVLRNGVIDSILNSESEYEFIEKMLKIYRGLPNPEYTGKIILNMHKGSVSNRYELRKTEELG